MTLVLTPFGHKKMNNRMPFLAGYFCWQGCNLYR